jgi:hypothetical protein
MKYGSNSGQTFEFDPLIHIDQLFRINIDYSTQIEISRIFYKTKKRELDIY